MPAAVVNSDLSVVNTSRLSPIEALAPRVATISQPLLISADKMIE